VKELAMSIIENSELAPVYHALDIAVGYLTRRGYSSLEAKERSIEHIARLYRSGERRPLMLANFAISAIERRERMEQGTGTKNSLPPGRQPKAPATN
jgi:hypothetical protein